MGREEDDIEVLRRRTSNLFRDLGPLIPFFETPSVTNVHVYGDGAVEVEEFGKDPCYACFVLTVSDRQRIVNSLASISDAPIDRWVRPTLETLIPDYNVRATAILPPWTRTPELTFRRPAHKIYTLDEYASSGRFSFRGNGPRGVVGAPPEFRDLYEKVAWHLENRSNIVVSGSTGSGKTTFLNALIERMARLTPDERFYVVEDVPELQCSAKRTTQLYIRKDQAVAAIQTALRWTPKRIIFGEIRSGEVAVELLEAWNTGHPGNVTTIHANDAASTVARIQGLLRQVIAGRLPDLSSAIQLIVHVSSSPGFGPFIKEVLTLDEINSMNTAS
jgi:type IV secretion system protein VirB11